MEYGQLISQVGFPVAAAIYLAVQNRGITEKFIQISENAATIIAASTAAIERSNKVIEKNTEAFDGVKEALIKVGGVQDETK